MADPKLTSPNRERAFNAPPGALLVAALILFIAACQFALGPDWPERFGLIPQAFLAGAWGQALTYMAIHGGWAHAGSNALGALTFGAPLARRLGKGPRGLAAHFAFFVICGALTGLIYSLVHRDSPTILIGASGAVFGLIGASTRLMDPRRPLAPILSRGVLTPVAAWVGVNLIVAVLGYDPATGVRSVAWDAHLMGLAIGLILVGHWRGLFLPPPAPPLALGPWTVPPNAAH